jgi:cadherin 4 type 1 (R-cadherin)
MPVKVQDGYPGMGYTTQAEVTVTVLDANDHAPVFLENPYRVDVGELKSLNVNILEIAATDTDKGLNSEVSFRIIGGDPSGIFKVNSKPNAAGKSIGEISLQKELDYETTRRYVLTVQGYNKDATNANDPAYMATTNVEVTVLDENEPPVFVNTPYAGTVDENKGAPITVGRVTAKDDDFQGTQTITYTIENPEGWFSIDDSGNIQTEVALDREDPAVDQATNHYILHIRATDNGTPPKSSVADMVVTINDVNDNPPQPTTEWVFSICEQPVNRTIGTISVDDIDGPSNGSPFTFKNALQATFLTEKESDNSAYVLVLPDATFDVDKQDKYEEFITISDNPASGPSKSTQALLTVKICRCDENNRCLATQTKPAGFAFAYIIAIVAAVLIILIIVLAVVAYKRRQEVEMEKQNLFPDDDDDVRENLQAYHDEGGGEEDNDAYDMAALQPLPPGAPARIDEKPQHTAQPQPRFARDMPPDTDIGEYIDDAKKQADNDPTAPPFDSLLVFDYEGQGSDAGSLSSLNSGTSDGSQDYNYLNNWGPRFQKLADMYGGGEDD